MGYGSSQDLDLRFFKPNAPGNGDAAPKRSDATSRRSDVSADYSQDLSAVDETPAATDTKPVSNRARGAAGQRAALEGAARRARRSGVRNVMADRSFDGLSEAYP